MSINRKDNLTDLMERLPQIPLNTDQKPENQENEDQQVIAENGEVITLNNKRNSLELSDMEEIKSGARFSINKALDRFIAWYKQNKDK